VKSFDARRHARDEILTCMRIRCVLTHGSTTVDIMRIPARKLYLRPATCTYFSDPSNTTIDLWQYQYLSRNESGGVIFVTARGQARLVSSQLPWTELQDRDRPRMHLPEAGNVSMHLVTTGIMQNHSLYRAAISTVPSITRTFLVHNYAHCCYLTVYHAYDYSSLPRRQDQ
jgi:hypothetical protein